jgi:hypothetical protein
MPTKSNPAEGNGGALKGDLLRGKIGSANTPRRRRGQGTIGTNLEYNASRYADGCDWSVFPCRPISKEPACRHGFYEATTNPETIKRWWRANPEYNIGVRTGIASGVWVLDVDGDDGVKALRALLTKHGLLPHTAVSITGAGYHIWWRYTSPIPSSADDRIGRGLHVRGDGGYALAPPSVHPNGKLYRWHDDQIYRQAVAPDWLVALTRKRPTISERALAAARIRYCESPGAYGKAALEHEIATLANTLKGGRNAALNRASFCLHQLVAGGELSAAEVHRRLLEAAAANGLMSDPEDGPRAVQKTIASGARAGLQHPRRRS